MLKLGIIGEDGVGKTTIFKLFTDESLAKPHNPNIANITIPDERVDFLASIFKPKKIVYPKIEFIDPQGFSRSSLAHVVRADILVYVIPFFNKFNKPKDYLHKLEEEIIIRDNEICETAIKKAEVEELLKKCKNNLDKSYPLRKTTFDEKEQRLLVGYGFLSQKPVFIILNAENIELKTKEIEEFKSYAQSLGFNHIIDLDAKFEIELKELTPEERKEFVDVYEPPLKKFIKILYPACHFERSEESQYGAPLVDFITFFTVVRNEIRAWHIKKGTNAFEAAGKIHSDIQRGFIKAEIIKFNDFRNTPSIKEIKEKNLIHLVDRNYIIEEGDIIEFKFHI